jgi:hypothetical protein
VETYLGSAPHVHTSRHSDTKNAATPLFDLERLNP